jgi:hypothetical protein
MAHPESLTSNKMEARAAFALRKGREALKGGVSNASAVSRRERTEASFMADGRDALSTQQSLTLQGMYSSSSCDSEAASESSVDTNQSDSCQPQPRRKTLFDEEREWLASGGCNADCEGCDRCADKWSDRHERPLEVMAVADFEKLVPPAVKWAGENWMDERDWDETRVRVGIGGPGAGNLIAVEGRTKYIEAVLLHEGFVLQNGIGPKWVRPWSAEVVRRIRRWGSGSHSVGFSKEVRIRMTETL